LTGLWGMYVDNRENNNARPDVELAQPGTGVMDVLVSEIVEGDHDEAHTSPEIVEEDGGGDHDEVPPPPELVPPPAT